MTIRVPEQFKSSKGDGKVSRTIKGLGATVVLFGAQYTPLTEAEWTVGVNAALILLAAAYTLYGLTMKAYNRTHAEKK